MTTSPPCFMIHPGGGGGDRKGPHRTVCSHGWHMTTKRHADELARTILAAGQGPVLAVTGAGVSAASGIPTFRGADESAIWHKDPMELATRSYFESDPVGQWRWYFERFDTVFGARPNAAHRALAMLEGWFEQRGGSFLLVTQNIDTLHEQAGSRHLVKVHGTADRVRCSRTGCRHGAPRGSLPPDAEGIRRFRDEPCAKTLPRCPACGSNLRAHVLFFDEYYNEHDDYQFDRVVAAAGETALVLFVGTSFSVGVTDLVVREAARRGVPLATVDPNAPDTGGRSRGYRDAAEELLPETCRVLGIDDA